METTSKEQRSMDARDALTDEQLDATLRLARAIESSSQQRSGQALAERIGTTSEVHAAAAAQRDAERSGELVWRD